MCTDGCMKTEGPFFYQLSEAEVVRATTLIARKTAVRGLGGYALAITIVMCFALVAIDAADGLLNLAATLAVCVVLPLVLGALWLAVPYHARRQVRQNAALVGRQSIAFDERSANLTGPRGTLTVPLHELHGYTLKGGFLFLHQSEGSANVVPVAALAGAENLLIRRLQAAGVRTI